MAPPGLEPGAFSDLEQACEADVITIRPRNLVQGLQGQPILEDLGTPAFPPFAHTPTFLPILANASLNEVAATTLAGCEHKDPPQSSVSSAVNSPEGAAEHDVVVMRAQTRKVVAVYQVVDRDAPALQEPDDHVGRENARRMGESVGEGQVAVLGGAPQRRAPVTRWSRLFTLAAVLHDTRWRARSGWSDDTLSRARARGVCGARRHVLARQRILAQHGSAFVDVSWHGTGCKQRPHLSETHVNGEADLITLRPRNIPNGWGGGHGPSQDCQDPRPHEKFARKLKRRNLPYLNNCLLYPRTK
ncbi:hypothetical protein BKA93DRAFT_863371 [Sparassis latifolia]